MANYIINYIDLVSIIIQLCVYIFFKTAHIGVANNTKRFRNSTLIRYKKFQFTFFTLIKRRYHTEVS